MCCNEDMKHWIILAVFGGLIAAPASADEGMWTFDNPPVKLLRDKYHYALTAEWLNHVRLASARLNDGGSGSFVSPHGLLLTNHHVARGQLQKDSTPQHNYARDGFYARTEAEELKSPDLEVNVLVSTEDVTRRVEAGTKSAKTPEQQFGLRRSIIAEIEPRCRATDFPIAESRAQFYRMPQVSKLRLLLHRLERRVWSITIDEESVSFPVSRQEVRAVRVLRRADVETPSPERQVLRPYSSPS